MTDSSATKKMMDALRIGDKEDFMTALEEGADVDAHEGEPLILAAEFKRYDFAKELCAREANIDIAIKTADRKRLEAYYLIQSTKNHAQKEQIQLAYNGYQQAKITLELYKPGLRDVVRVRQETARTQAVARIADVIEQFRLTVEEVFGSKGLEKALPAPAAKKKDNGPSQEKP